MDLRNCWIDLHHAIAKTSKDGPGHRGRAVDAGIQPSFLFTLIYMVDMVVTGNGCECKQFDQAIALPQKTSKKKTVRFLPLKIHWTLSQLWSYSSICLVFYENWAGGRANFDGKQWYGHGRWRSCWWWLSLHDVWLGIKMLQQGAEMYPFDQGFLTFLAHGIKWQIYMYPWRNSIWMLTASMSKEIGLLLSKRNERLLVFSSETSAAIDKLRKIEQ